MSLSFRQSILCLMGISLLVTVLVGGIGGYYMLKNMRSVNYQFENTVAPAMYMEEIKTNYWTAHALMLQMALDKEPVLIRQNYYKVRHLHQKNEDLLQLYEKTHSGARELELYEGFKEKRQAYLEMFGQALDLDLLTTTDQSISSFNHFNNIELQPFFQAFIDSVDELSAHIMQEASNINALNEHSSHNALMTMIAIILVAIALLFLAAYFFISSIMCLVNRLTGFAASIAANDFSDKLEPPILGRRDELGKMSRALAQMQGNLSRNITMLNRTAETLTESNEQAQKANEYKSAFLSRMSHEIRTPLNAIIGMTYMAKKAKDNTAVNDALNKIITSSAHLLGIINDILDMSKIEAGKFELMDDEFSLETLLMNVCTVAAVKTDKKEQNLLVGIESDMPSRFIGDSLRLSQVLTNIVDNASKFTPLKGSIKLSASCVEKNNLFALVRFEIEDTGIGLTQEQIGRLFTPFEQADGSTSRQFGGTGLGLSICDKIAKLMDGGISVESEFGKGSRFIVTVKLKNSAKVESAMLDHSIDLRSARMLVVDATKGVREFFSNLFSYLDISVATAANTEMAMALLRESRCEAPFTIVFLDWNTAEDAGVDFVKFVKDEFGRQVVVVLVSSAKFAEVKERAGAAGVNRFLPKPVFPSSVINLINEVLGAPEAAAQRENSSETDFSGKSILLAEDVDINREIVFAYLENSGLRIDVAENGVEAVEKYLAVDGKYDAVLMDIHMPLMDGYTAAKRIRAEEEKRGWPHGPIIAMTANVFKEDIQHCLEAGMDDHLAKPMSVESLLEMLLKYLNV